MSSREFSHNTTGAKKAAESAAVYITDVHRMAAVTRNTKDFERFPDLNVVNPWR